MSIVGSPCVSPGSRDMRRFELHQLKLTNKRLREELDTLESARKKRKKKLQAVQSIPPVPGVRSCANCGRSDSPEWRKGPSGARDLCNVGITHLANIVLSLTFFVYAGLRVALLQDRVIVAVADFSRRSALIDGCSCGWARHGCHIWR